MSVCPKCKQPLKIYNLGQNCPHCGVNMRFYDFEDRFYIDAKKAELAFGNIHIMIRKLRRGFIANKLAVARLAVLLLPLLSMLVPTAEFTFKLPFLDGKLPVSALGMYSIFTDGTFGYIGQMAGSQILSSGFKPIEISVYAFLASALCAVLVFLCTILAFVSVKNMSRILCTLSVLGSVSGIVSTVAAANFLKTADGIFGGKTGFGCIVSTVCFAVVFILNFLIIRRGLPVEYPEGDEERAAIAKKVKRGEIRLEDLPQPVVETEETRQIADEIKKERERYEQKQQEDAENAEREAKQS